MRLFDALAETLLEQTAGPATEMGWVEIVEGLWLMEFFGILRFAQDDSRNKNDGKDNGNSNDKWQRSGCQFLSLMTSNS